MVIFYSNSKTCNVLFYVNDYYCYHCVALSVYSASEIWFSFESVEVVDFVVLLIIHSYSSMDILPLLWYYIEWVCLGIVFYIFVPSLEF